MFGDVVWAVITGAVLGYLAKLLLPGKQDIPAWATIGAGIVAALLAGLVAGWLGVFDCQPPFQSADQLTDGDVTWLAAEAIPPARSDLTLQESAPPKGQQDGLEELVGEDFLFR